MSRLWSATGLHGWRAMKLAQQVGHRRLQLMQAFTHLGRSPGIVGKPPDRNAFSQAQEVPKLFGDGSQRVPGEFVATLDKTRSLFSGEVFQPAEEIFHGDRVVVGLQFEPLPL